MKQKVIEIRQIASSSAKTVRADIKGKEAGYGEFTAFPNSVRSFVPMRKADSTFITGLTSAEETELGKILGQDLSPTSSFWETFRIYYAMPNGSMQWDLQKPIERLRYKVALANKLLAPDEETLRDDPDYIKLNVHYYVFDEDQQEAKVSALNEIKDEISALLHKSRNNREKLLYLCSGLNKFVTSGMKAESLYNLLHAEKEKLKKFEALERFRDFLKSTPERLQAIYFVKEGVALKVLKFEADISKYRFPLANEIVGRNTKEVEDFFADEKNAEFLALLANEVTEARQ